MIIVERLIQNVRPGKWAELDEIEKRFTAAETKAGFPPKKRFQCLIGGLPQGTLIIERQWESMAAMEAAYEKLMASPEWQTLTEDVFGMIESSQTEVYTPIP